MVPSNMCAKLVMVTAFLLLSTRCTNAELQLPAHLSSGVILQTWRGFHVATHLYGTAAPGELVTVAAAVENVPPFSAIADANGNWALAYNWPPGPTCWDDFNLTFSGSETANSLTLVGVRWGDAVLCLGDEAAVFPMNASADSSTWLKANEKALSYIRLFDAEASEWVNASDTIAASQFSALCLRTAVEATKAHGFGGNSVIGIIPLVKEGGAVEDFLPPAGVAMLNSCPPLPGAPVSPPGDLWQPALANFPFRYFAIALGTADASRLVVLGSSVRAAAAYACRLRALVLGLREGAVVGDSPVILLEPLPVALGNNAAAIFPLRVALASLLPADPSGLWIASGIPGKGVSAVALGSGLEAGIIEPIVQNITSLTMYAAKALIYTAWWAFSVPSAGPATRGATAAGTSGSSVRVRFAFSPGGINNGTLQLLPVRAGACDVAGAAMQWSNDANATEGKWLEANVTVAVDDDARSLLVIPSDASIITPPAFLRYGAGGNECVLVDAVTGIPAPAFIVALATATTAGVVAMQPNTPTTSASITLVSPRTSAHPTPLPEGIAARRQYLIESHERRNKFVAENTPTTPLSILAPTPPLYFNTWQAYRCNLDEELMRRTGDALISLGLAQIGYTHVNMDDCEWRSMRDNVTGAVVPDETRFPSGMSALSAYFASLTPPLTLGVYTSATSSTCVGRPGSYENEAIDAATYCGWGASWVKVDKCGGTAYPTSNTSWIKLRAAMDTCPHPMLLSVESCGVPQGGSGSNPNCADWIDTTGAQMFRTTADMQLYWQSVVFNLDGNEPMAPLAGPGHWPDPDMLIVGHPGLTPPEIESHIAAFAVVAAPLGLSFDLVQGPLDDLLIEQLSNAAVLAVNQDAVGIAGVRATAANSTGVECWAKPLSAGSGNSSAVLLFNRGQGMDNVYCSWADVLPHWTGGGNARVTDLWTGVDLGVFSNGFEASAVPSHGSMLVLVLPLA